MIRKDKIWTLTSNYKKTYTPDADRGWAALQEKIAAEQETTPRIIKMKNPGRWWRVAAIFVLFVGAGFIFQQFLNGGLETLATAEGAVKQLLLADGTEVWLNENSQLHYPEAFDGKERKVVLQGEAFFEVSKNEEKPFVIELEEGQIRVVGTSFNVRSLESEDFVEVEVASGKVIFACDDIDPMAMTANSKCVFDKKTTKMTTSKSANLNGMAWKREELRFQNTPLKEVFESLERFYKIEFEVVEKSIFDCDGFTSRLKKDNLQKAITILSEIYVFEFKETADHGFLVKGGTCPH